MGFLWFTGRQWFALCLLITGMLIVIYLLDFTGFTFPSDLLPHGNFLEWVILFGFIVLFVGLFTSFWHFYKRWVRNPNPTWLDVVNGALGFSFCFAFLFLEPHRLRLHSSIWLGFSFLIILEGKLFAMRKKKVASQLFMEADDAPLSDFVTQDEFSRQAFLGSILTAITKCSENRSRVIAITGPWGSGKTTLIRAAEKLLPKNYEPIWIDSWQYRNTGKLIEAVIAAIAKHTGKYVHFHNPGRLVQKYSGLISPAVPGVKPWMDEIVKIITVGDDTEELKKELEQLVQATGKQFIVFLDDIERLTGSEIHDVLKTVRLAVSLKYITYVLAFDKDQLMADLELEMAPDFLDKIIDEEYEIPKPNSSDYIRFLKKHCNLPAKYLPQEHKLVEDFNDRWPDVERSLARILDTPRKIKKIGISSWLHSSKMRLEINPLDYLLLEVLRQRFPFLYQVIKTEPQLFWNEAWVLHDSVILYKQRMGMGSEDTNKRSHQRQQLLEKCGDSKSNVQILVDILFSADSDEQSCSRLRRICHPHFFDSYFTLAFLQGEGQEAFVETLIAKINTAPAPEQARLVNKLLVQTEFDAAMQNFQTFRLFYEDFDTRAVSQIIPHITKAYEQCRMSDSQERQRVSSVAEDLISKLISRLSDDQEATNILIPILRNSSDLLFAIQLTRRVKLATNGYKSSSFGERKPDVAKCQNVLDELIEERILAKNIDLFALPNNIWWSAICSYSKPDQMKAIILPQLQIKPAYCVQWLENLSITHSDSENSFEFVPPDIDHARKFPLLAESFEILSQSKSSLVLNLRETVLVDGFLAWYQQNIRHLAKKLPSK